MVGLGVLGTGGRHIENPGVPGTPRAAGAGEVTLGVAPIDATSICEAAICEAAICEAIN